MNQVKFVSKQNKEFYVERNAVASINPNKCVNCGTCRELCPVGAIQENQRAVCRICPDCTGKPGLTVNEMYSLATEKSCTTGCPLGISPQGYINLINDDKLDEAYKLIWDKNPLPSICSRVCHHPCENNCKRGILVDTPLAIKGIKRYLSEKIDYIPTKYIRMYEEKIAIIGAGPVGLTAGHYLSKIGYEVTLFEGAVEAGGMLKRGIPEFRLDRDVVDKEVSNLEKAGLAIKRGVQINKISLDKIKKEYDVVIVATGAPNSKELQIEGWRMNGVMTAMSFMQQTIHNQEIMHHLAQSFEVNGEVVVIGGGSVAIDTARTALRLGASKVTVVCLESGENIPCHSWELDEAREEGIEIMEGYSPIRFVGGMNLKLDGVELCKVTSFNKDSSGRISFTTDKENTTLVNADWAIVAIGQKPDSLWTDISDNNVFFAGDVKNSACSVIDSMASARRTAIEVDAYLRGSEMKDTVATHTLHEAPPNEKVYLQNRRKTLRPERPLLNVEERIHSFDEVEGSFNDLQAKQEAMRCLQCGYHMVDEDKCIGCGICQKMCPKGDVIIMKRIDEGGEA